MEGTDAIQFQIWFRREFNYRVSKRTRGERKRERSWRETRDRLKSRESKERLLKKPLSELLYKIPLVWWEASLAFKHAQTNALCPSRIHDHYAYLLKYILLYEHSETLSHGMIPILFRVYKIVCFNHDGSTIKPL